MPVNLGSNFEELLRKNDPNKKIDIRTMTRLRAGCRPGSHRCLRDGPRSTAQLIKESKLLQQAGAPFETIENALPFLKTPEKQALLKKVEAPGPPCAKTAPLTKISGKMVLSGHHQQINDGI